MHCFLPVFWLWHLQSFCKQKILSLALKCLQVSYTVSYSRTWSYNFGPLSSWYLYINLFKNSKDIVEVNKTLHYIIWCIDVLKTIAEHYGDNHFSGRWEKHSENTIHAGIVVSAQACWSLCLLSVSRELSAIFSHGRPTYESCNPWVLRRQCWNNIDYIRSGMVTHYALSGIATSGV